MKFIKRSFDGVQVESKHGAETGWSVLGNYVRSPIQDVRPALVAGAPEVRQYRMRYLRGNNPVGNASDILTITTLP